MANDHPVGNRKPRENHVRNNSLRSRNREVNTPEPTSGAPDPPEPFGDDELAAREWARMLCAFDDMKMLHKVDAFVLYQHCKLFAATERIEQQQAEAESDVAILERNLVHMEKSELPKAFTEIIALRKIISKGNDQLRAGRNALRIFLGEFGLTPASRGRITLPPVADVTDDFAAAQQRRISMNAIR